MSVASQRQIQVLHVDDEPSLTDLTATFLEREDDRFTVETATSADKGLEQINDCPPDCVVSDYNMPGMDGLEFLQSVREEYPDLPFILYTGKGSEAVASEAIAADVTDYLQKGSGSEQYELLANRIRNAVQSRRKSERADRQEHLMRLTEFAGNTGGFELDRETGTVLLTAGTRRFIGCPDQSEISLQEAIELFHPDDRGDIQQTLTGAFETGEELHDRCRLQPSDGDERLLDITVTPVAENGEVTKLRGVGHDTTDREERQRELEQIETLFQHAQDSLFLIDVADEHSIERVNPAWEDKTGFSAERVRGQTPRDILGEQPGAAAEEKYRECIQRQEPLQYEETIRFDGEVTYWKTQIAPVVVDGTVEYIAGSTRDVTHRKKRGLELQELKSQYETLAENFPAGAVYLIDTDLRFERARGKELERIGLSPNDFEGKKPHALFPEEIADELCHYLEKALDGHANTFEQEYGGERYRLQVVPVRIDGEAIDHVMGVSQNITEYAEDKQNLERQNERLAEFASIVSHDLRNPLQVAGGRLELVRDECESDHIGDIEQALDRMDTLIADLLTLAREGEQVDETEPVGLASVAKTSWQTVSTEQAVLETERSQAIEADRSRLRQLFENLYRNAVEHGGNDVTASVGETSDGFYVADTGPGIPEADREEVFEAGYSTNEDGTGFGLRIVEQIADAHGWEVAVTESEQGGARFEVTGVESADR